MSDDTFKMLFVLALVACFALGFVAPGPAVCLALAAVCAAVYADARMP